MRIEQFRRLRRPIAQGKFGGHAERVKRMDIAARRKNLRAADQIAAGHGGDETARKCAQNGGNFGIAGQQRINPHALGRVHRRQQVQIIGTGGGRHRAAHHVQPVRDQRIFGFQQLQPQRGWLMPRHINSGGLLHNQRLKIGQIMRVRSRNPPAGQRFFQLNQTLVEARLRQRRCQMRDGDRVRPTLCQRGLRRVVRRIKIDVGHLADQMVWPIASPKACLLTRHEFQSTVHPEMQ